MRLLIITQKVDQNDPILGFFHRWIVEFAKQSRSVIVICLEEGAHELPANVRVLSLGKDRLKGRATYVSNFYRYVWKERKNYDSVFIHMNPIYIILGGWLWKILGKKISLWYTHKHVDLRLRIAELLVDRIFTASKESFRLPSCKLIVTGHGIDTDYFIPAKNGSNDSDTVKIVTAGRISATKRVKEMIEALAELTERKIDASLTIVGGPVTASDRSYMSGIEDMIVQNGIRDRVSVLGPLAPHEVLSYLWDADIFINMSSTGSLDKAVLEAMACGVVSVSSNEAFRDVLEPLGLYFDVQTGKGCADAVMRVAQLDLHAIGMGLREWVVSNHSLHNLIPLLVNNMREMA